MERDNREHRDSVRLDDNDEPVRRGWEVPRRMYGFRPFASGLTLPWEPCRADT